MRRAGILAASSPKRAPSAETPPPSKHEVLRHDPVADLADAPLEADGGEVVLAAAIGAAAHLEVGAVEQRRQLGVRAQVRLQLAPQAARGVTASRQLSAPGQLTTSAGRAGAGAAPARPPARRACSAGQLRGAHPAQEHVLLAGEPDRPVGVARGRAPPARRSCAEVRLPSGTVTVATTKPGWRCGRTLVRAQAASAAACAGRGRTCGTIPGPRGDWAPTRAASSSGRAAGGRGAGRRHAPRAAGSGIEGQRRHALGADPPELAPGSPPGSAPSRSSSPAT